MDEFEKKFWQWIKNKKSLISFFHEFNDNGSIILWGGSLRSYLMNGFDIEPRDIDFTYVSNNIDFNIDKIASRYGAQKNRFDGYKVTIDDLTIDFWSWENTWAVKNKIVRINNEAIHETLLETIFLNIDGLLYDLKEHKWFDEPYRKALISGELDIVLCENPQLSYNLVRGMINKRRLKLKYSTTYAQIVNRYFNETEGAIDKLIDSLVSHGLDEEFSINDLNEELNTILI